LPELLRSTASARRQGRLAVVFVTREPNSAAGHLKQTIRQYGIDCPVLFYGDGPKTAHDDWDISGNPMGFLIDPQGVIAARARGAAEIVELEELCLWLLEHGGDVARARVRTAAGSADRRNVDLTLELSSPQRKPLAVQVDYVLYDLIYDENNKMVDVIKVKPVEHGPEMELTADCGAWGETIERVAVDLTGYDGLQYEVRVLLPGTGEARDGQGFWVRQRGWYYFDGDKINGEKN
jgi:hypothetical protein